MWVWPLGVGVACGMWVWMGSENGHEPGVYAFACWYISSSPLTLSKQERVFGTKDVEIMRRLQAAAGTGPTDPCQVDQRADRRPAAAGPFSTDYEQANSVGPAQGGVYSRELEAAGAFDVRVSALTGTRSSPLHSDSTDGPASAAAGGPTGKGTGLPVHASTAEPFVEAEAWEGSRAGYVFKAGERGLGYYLDTPSHLCAALTESGAPSESAARTGPGAGLAVADEGEDDMDALD